MPTAVTKDRTMDVWEWCRDIYMQVGGMKLKLPRHTDPAKTYQYRYAQRLAQRLAEWQFDEPTSRRFIELAIIYARERGLLHKGLSLLCQGNLAQVAWRRLQQEQDRSQDALELLERTTAWMNYHAGPAPTTALLRRSHPDGYCNLVKWYRERQLSDLYLALSASCGRALERLERLDPSERQELPAQSRLYLTRLAFLQDKTNSAAAKRIMAGDWRQCP